MRYICNFHALKETQREDLQLYNKCSLNVNYLQSFPLLTLIDNAKNIKNTIILKMSLFSNLFNLY